MILKRIGPFSLAKISGLTYGFLGLLAGLIFSFFSLVLSGLAPQNELSNGFIPLLFGVGSIFFLPIFYGLLGFITGALTAWIYNLISNWVGGLELEFDTPQDRAQD